MLISALKAHGQVSRFADVVSLICEARGFTKEELFATRRNRRATAARHEIAWIGRNMLKMTLGEIGRALGVDHTTVLNGLRRVHEWLHDPVYAVEFTGIALRVRPVLRLYSDACSCGDLSYRNRWAR